MDNNLRINITSATNKTSITGYEYIQIVVGNETTDVPKEEVNPLYQEILRQVKAGTLTIEEDE
jgi:hypothetical protein